MIQEYHHSDGYSAIRNIKGRPMIISDVNIQEINDFTHSNPIDKIADGAAENQRQADGQKPETLGCFHIKVENKTDGERRDEKK